MIFNDIFKQHLWKYPQYNIIRSYCSILHLFKKKKKKTRMPNQYRGEVHSLLEKNRFSCILTLKLKCISNDFISPLFRQCIKWQPSDIETFPECTLSLILHIPFKSEIRFNLHVALGEIKTESPLFLMFAFQLESTLISCPRSRDMAAHNYTSGRQVTWLSVPQGVYRGCVLSARSHWQTFLGVFLCGRFRR